MGLPVLIYGKSGSGKSRSLKFFGEEEILLFNIEGKALPFRQTFKYVCRTDNVDTIIEQLLKMPCKSAVIDDAGYLITNTFMGGHSNTGTGNAQFQFYNKLADQFWGLVQYIINDLPVEKIVYVMMHEEQDDFGNIKPKTIGKLLDQKVCIEGMFTIVLRAVADSQGHAFITQAEDMAVSKSPLGMFESDRIDNDLILVEKAIRDYYEIPVQTEAEADHEKAK